MPSRASSTTASTTASVTAAARRQRPPPSQTCPSTHPTSSAPPAAMAEEAGHEPGLPYVLAPLRNAAIAAGLLRPKAWPTLLVELNHTNPSSP